MPYSSLVCLSIPTAFFPSSSWKHAIKFLLLKWGIKQLNTWLWSPCDNDAILSSFVVVLLIGFVLPKTFPFKEQFYLRPFPPRSLLASPVLWPSWLLSSHFDILAVTLGRQYSIMENHWDLPRSLVNLHTMPRSKIPRVLKKPNPLQLIQYSLPSRSLACRPLQPITFRDAITSANACGLVFSLSTLHLFRHLHKRKTRSRLWARLPSWDFHPISTSASWRTERV